ncbi:MAG: orotate phosphoribosyltransferase [Paludibacteraceae bacterium]|nr:orotate phosphoribosyltransferase [Paludibacteraceae bacterium]
MKELEDFIALKLLNLKAIKLQAKNPFEWNTGWLSPIYFDSRKILSYPGVRNIIKVELARLIVEKYTDVEAIAAVAPNAIAIGMLVADTLGLPFVYVTSKPKSHGFENRIEGDLKVHAKVVIVADQLSLGTSSMSAQEALQDTGADVIGVATILDYEFHERIDAFRKTDLEWHALTSYTSVIEKACEMGRINAAEAEIIRTWHLKPGNWMPQNKTVRNKKK